MAGACYVTWKKELAWKSLGLESLNQVVVFWTLINLTCFMSVVTIDQYYSILLEKHLILSYAI